MAERGESDFTNNFAGTFLRCAAGGAATAASSAGARSLFQTANLSSAISSSARPESAETSFAFAAALN